MNQVEVGYRHLGTKNEKHLNRLSMGEVRQSSRWLFHTGSPTTAC